MSSSKYRTQQTLLERLKDRHDEQAWEDYVFHYQYFIYSILIKMGFSHHDGEDLKQEVLLRSWKALENFNYDPQKCRFRSWLSIITRNHARNYFSSKAAKLDKLKDERSACEIAEFEKVSESDLELIIEKEWEKHITKLAWETIRNSFNSKALEVYLDMSKEMPVPEVSRKHGITEGSTYVYKQRVHRALCKEICRLDKELG